MAVALLGIKETAPGERRVALTPETARKLGALGITVWYEAGATWPPASPMRPMTMWRTRL